ncbi:MAG: alpha/beta hydrolase [Myxococcales bacterium]|nr:alpha/beta hydrolase [Myxococcales bacterium]
MIEEATPFDAPGAFGMTLHGLSWSTTGVPFVMLHGFGNDAHIWEEFAPEVAPYYRTLALDLRGHGDSAHDPEQRYDYPYHVADLENATAALQIDRLVLVGHSFGGRVATLFAEKHSERLAGLVIVDSGPEFDQRGTSRIRTETERHRQREESFSSVAEYEDVMARAYPAASRKTVRRLAAHGLRRRGDGRFERKTDPRFHAGRSGLSEAEQEARSAEMTATLWTALEKIPCPTLVVRGAASDVLAAETADRMVEVLPEGSLEIVPRASHSVMTDNPEGFAEAVTRFALGDG